MQLETRLCLETFEIDNKYILLMRLKQQREVNVKREYFTFKLSDFQKEKKRPSDVLLNFMQRFETGHVASYFIH